MMSPLPMHQKFDNCFFLVEERKNMEYMYGGREGRLWRKDAKAVLPIVHGGKVLMTRYGKDLWGD